MADVRMDSGKQGNVGAGTAAGEMPAKVAFGMRGGKEFAGPDGCRPNNEMWFVGPYGVPKDNPLARERGDEKKGGKPAEKQPEKERKPVDMLWRMMEAVM